MKQKLTVRAALADLGWFSALFSAVVGGPSVLALLQMIFVEHRLIDALQWIVDGYSGIMAVVGAVLEPLLAPAIAWLGRLFDVRLELHPHWQPLLMLAMLWVSTGFRAGGHRAHHYAMIAGMGLAALLGAVAAGLVSLEGGWPAQGLAVALPVGVMLAALGGFAAIGVALGEVKPTEVFDFLAAAAILTAFCFLLGAGISFVPGLRSGAGVVAFGVVMVGLAVFYMMQGLGGLGTQHTRIGLTMLGGFFAAGMILAADAGVKALS